MTVRVVVTHSSSGQIAITMKGDAGTDKREFANAVDLSEQHAMALLQLRDLQNQMTAIRTVVDQASSVDLRNDQRDLQSKISSLLLEIPF